MITLYVFIVFALLLPMLPRSTTVFLPNLLIFPTIKFYLYCPNSWMFPLSLEHDRVIKGYTLWWILSSLSRELNIGSGLLARVKSEANPRSVLRFGLAHRLAHVLKMLSQQLWIPEFTAPLHPEDTISFSSSEPTFMTYYVFSLHNDFWRFGRGLWDTSCWLFCQLIT